MDIKVRVGTRGDIPALVDVECSGVVKWYHFFDKGRGEEASYDGLSSLERTMHGGPWMDLTALTNYWRTIEQLGIIPLVAEIKGKVVGHLDVILTDELPLGRFLYLDVLTVHKAYRRRGVATTLIREAEKLAKKKKAEFMLVQPQRYEGPSGLTYRSCGFEKAFDTYQSETPVNHPKFPLGVQLVSIPQSQEAPLKTHTMICGWYNISAKKWYYAMNPDLETLRALSCSDLALSVLINKGTYFFHVRQNCFDHSKGTLSLWAPASLNQKEIRIIFQVSKTVASWLGIKTLKTKTIERYLPILEKEEFEIKSKGEPYLIKNINH